MAFVGEEYREEQATYRADLVASVGRNKYLHVEQQTKHSRHGMLERLAKYALLISAFYDFNIQLFQMYYYTGPDRVKWLYEALPAARVNNANWAISSRFLFINSADHEADRMLASQNFSYATLGLLARKISPDFIPALVSLGRDQLGHDSHRWRDELATCITVASLRGREKEVWEVLEQDDKKFLSRNGWWLSDAMIKELHNWRSIGNVQILLDLRDLEDIVGERFSREFMQWASHKLSFEEVEALKATASGGFKSFQELLEDSGIEWPVISQRNDYGLTSVTGLGSNLGD
jgi:hypothetical protein